MKTLKIKHIISKLKTIILLIISLVVLNSCSKDECGYNDNCFVPKTINVSTGVDAAGNPLPYGTIDPLWQIVASAYPAGTPALSCSPNGAWEPTPVIATNANWINATGADCCSNLTGNYTFERSFTIVPGTTDFTCNFGIAFDDVLVSIELVAPDSSIITLTPTTSVYTLSAPITDTVTSPLPGIWKIRVVVNFIDVIGAFITSGTIDIKEPCI